MPVRIGSAEPDTFYLGASQLDALYLGSQLLWQNFTPIDMTWNTPGTYMLDIGNGTHVYMSGRGADGGGGGGGGHSESDIGFPLSNATPGLGGTGRPGADGQDGERQLVEPGRFFPEGGGGEAGESPPDATVSSGGTTLFTADSGGGGNGGYGGNENFGGNADNMTNGPPGGQEGGEMGTGAAGGTGGRAQGDPIISRGSDGFSGYLGTTIGERLFTDIAHDTILTIVVPEHGVGGNPGGNASRAGRMPGIAATVGADGVNDGWIRIRVTRE